MSHHDIHIRFKILMRSAFFAILEPGMDVGSSSGPFDPQCEI